MEDFFCPIYEFLMDAEKFDVTNFLCNNFPHADTVDDVVDNSPLFLPPLRYKLRPMTSIGRPEASNTRALS